MTSSFLYACTCLLFLLVVSLTSVTANKFYPAGTKYRFTSNLNNEAIRQRLNDEMDTVLKKEERNDVVSEDTDDAGFQLTKMTNYRPCVLEGKCNSKKQKCCSPLTCDYRQTVEKKGVTVKIGVCITPSSTPTPTSTATPTGTATHTSTPTATATQTSTSTASASFSVTPSFCPTPCPEFMDPDYITECSTFWAAPGQLPGSINELERATLFCGHGLQTGPRSVRVDAPMCWFSCEGKIRTIMGEWGVIWDEFTGNDKRECAASMLVEAYPYNPCYVPNCSDIAEEFIEEFFEVPTIPDSVLSKAAACGLDDITFVGFRKRLFRRVNPCDRIPDA